MSDALRHLAGRAAADPFFLGFALAEFARSERFDDPGLAAALGCRAEDLPMLRLCRAPRPDPDFAADLRAVADRFGVEFTRLAEAVRLGQSLATIRAAPLPAGEAGPLLAARDDDEPGS